MTMGSYENLIDDIKRKKSVISVNGIIEEGLGHFLYSVNFHVPRKKIIITYDRIIVRRRYERSSYNS